MKEKEILEREMTPPRPPGFYELDSKGAIIVVSYRDQKLGSCGGWTDSLYSRDEWNRQEKSHKTLLNI